MGILTTLCEALVARRVMRGTVKRCRIQRLHCRDAWMLVSRLVADTECRSIDASQNDFSVLVIGVWDQ